MKLVSSLMTLICDHKLSHNFFLENYYMRAQELQYRFKQRNTKTQERVREQMVNANREIWVCDPDDPHATGI